MEVRKMQV